MTVAEGTGAIANGPARSGATGFRDPTVLTRWLRILLWIMIAIDVVAIISTLMQISLLVSFQHQVFESLAQARADAVASDAQQRLIGIVQIIGLLITAVVFLCWIHRGNANARQLGAIGMRFTPGWSVGWYFIPIANLWKPYQAMKEIWRASAAPAQWQSSHRSAVLPWWWFFFLVSGIAGNVSFRLALVAKQIPLLIAADVAGVTSDAASIAAALLALALIGQIHRMQMSHARA